MPFQVYLKGLRAQALRHAWAVIDTSPNDLKALGEAAGLTNRVIVVAKRNALEADRLVYSLDASGRPTGRAARSAGTGLAGPAGVCPI